MAETTASVETVSEVVIAMAMRHTHYRRDQLDPTADLEGELGIDSVVLIGIIGDAAKQLGLPANLTSDISVTTLDALIEELEAHDEYAASGVVPAEPAAVAEEKAMQEPELAPGDLDPLGPAGVTARDGRTMRDFLVSDKPDLFAKASEFAAHRRDREAEHLYWYGMPLRSRCTNRARIHNGISSRTREFLMFGSNNYLGLANHPEVVDAICAATREFGATNTGCRIIGGTNHLHKELERRLAAFKGREAAIVYPGGYAANLGAISAQPPPAGLYRERMAGSNFKATIALAYYMRKHYVYLPEMHSFLISAAHDVEDLGQIAQAFEKSLGEMLADQLFVT
ncbi:aminotransferase class I/II-fold pyridoxal phosphate-dependent enzyme [Nocardia salmonicida]|uniref:acyl carrier protein n=1 Tax=Nocardia salmonicida TaxID=53431 RepID=UPI003CEAEB8B